MFFITRPRAAAYNENCTSPLLFPTKALAQDQLSKLQTMLQQTSSNSDDNDLAVRPMTINADTSDASLAIAAETANVILTNPDTLHAAILPSWKTKQYLHMVSSLRYVVLDERHMYEGVFGAHVAMILRRLVRYSTAALIL